MASTTLLQKILNFVEGLAHDVDTAIEPGVDFLKKNAPAAAIALGENLLAAAESGSPWETLISSLLSQAASAGITLTEDAAKVVLNAAQNNLIANAANSAAINSAAASTVAAPVTGAQ